MSNWEPTTKEDMKKFLTKSGVPWITSGEGDVVVLDDNLKTPGYILVEGSTDTEDCYMGKFIPHLMPNQYSAFMKSNRSPYTPHVTIWQVRGLLFHAQAMLRANGRIDQMTAMRGRMLALGFPISKQGDVIEDLLKILKENGR